MDQVAQIRGREGGCNEDQDVVRIMMHNFPVKAEIVQFTVVHLIVYSIVKPSPVPSCTGCKEGGEAHTGHLLFLTLELLRKQLWSSTSRQRKLIPQEQKKVGSRARCNWECSVQDATRVDDGPTSPDDVGNRMFMVTSKITKAWIL